jgi:hypothetical protein
VVPLGKLLPGLFLMTDSFETGGSKRQVLGIGEVFGSPSYVCISDASRKGTFFGLGEVLNPSLGGHLNVLQSIKKPVAARSASPPKDCDRFMFFISCKSHADSCCSLGIALTGKKERLQRWRLARTL